MIKKIFGWALIVAGVVIIGWGIYDSFNIFTAKKEPPQVFSLPAQNQNASTSGTIDTQIQKIIGDQLSGILPANSISKLFSLVSWSIFAGILFFGGGHLAGIGTKLIKRDKADIDKEKEK